MKPLHSIRRRVRFLSLNMLGWAIFAASAWATSPERAIRVFIPEENRTGWDHPFQELAEDFGRKSGMPVKVMTKGGSFSTLKAVIAAHFAGDLPDIAVVSASDIKEFCTLNILTPIPDSWSKQMGFIENLKTPNVCDAQIRSLPLLRRVPVWFLNDDHLRKKNINAHDLSKPWPENIDTIAKIVSAADTKKTNGLIVGLGLASAGEMGISRWGALGFGLPFHRGQIDYALAWAKEVGTLFKKAGITPYLSDKNTTGLEVHRDFIEGRVLLYLGSMEQIPQIKSHARFSPKIILAKNSKENYWNGVDLIVLNPDFEKVKGLINAIYSPSNHSKLSERSPSLPVRKAYLSSAEWKTILAKYPLIEPAIALNAVHQNQHLISPAIRRDWSKAVWNEVRTVSETGVGLPETRSGLEKLLSTKVR